ncbi:uncharacterized protein BJ171DRAFT_107071 [Polychytrium aggregatum]|uniref:uncharacterized protein n=1 Tax=Polychytrium aggregatum TaxID=110093 RepID=UPI0022FF2816|nr:uncharacterized protein BJ171DRAFT_107071 [Polychytrium aggregatum]KAI9204463.1 hypothetical protein BJ171DRAFT_107071 [Polychytrium aggregatum]
MSPSGSRNPQILSSNGKDPLWCANADQLWKSIEAFSRKCDEQGSVDGNGALLFAMKPLELTSDALASLGMSREHSYGPYSSSNDGFSRHPSQHHSYPHTPSDPHSSPGRTSSPHSHHPGHMPHQIGYGHHPISPYQAQSLSSQSAMYEPYGRLYPPANYAHWSTEIRKFFENLGDERWSGYREESPFYNSSSHATPTTPKAPTPSTPDQLTTPTKYTCPRPGCGKTFTRKGNLESHLNSHDGRKAYKCEICDIFFVRQNDKRRHDKKHVPGANGKMYECEDCHSTFSRKDALIRHRNGNCKSKRWKVESTPDRSLSQRQDSATSPLGQHRLRYSDIRLLSFNGDPAAACLGDFGDISVTYTTVRLNHAANPIVWLNPFCFVAQPAASGGEVMYIFNTLKKGYHEIGNSTNSISTRIQTSFSFHKQKEPSEGPEDGAHGNGANKTEPAPDTEMSVELRPDESAVGQFDIVEVLSDAQVRLLSTDDSATPTTTATEALEASWLNPFSFWLEHKTSSGRVEPKCFVFHPSSSAPDGQSGIYLQLTNTANSMRESLILTIQLLRNEQHIILSGRGDPRSPQDSQDEGGLSDNGHLMETNGSGEDTPMPPKKRGRAKSDLSLHSPTKGSRRAGREDSLSGSPEGT